MLELIEFQVKLPVISNLESWKGTGTFSTAMISAESLYVHILHMQMPNPAKDRRG